MMIDFNARCEEKYKSDPVKQQQCAKELAEKCGNSATDADQQKCVDERFADGIKAGASTYSGYSYGGPLGKGENTQRLRQDVFLWSNLPAGFHANNFTFLQVDSVKGGSRSFYGETNLWLGHQKFPIDLTYQSIFASSGSDKGWVGLSVRVSDIPYIDAACKAVGLFAYVQVHPVGFDYSDNSRIKNLYIEYFYILDPLKDGIRPKLLGFADHFIDYSGNQVVNTEHRLELAVPLAKNLEAGAGLEWRRYSFLPGSERDKEIMAGILSLRVQ